jgi:hypothetical protein
MSGDLYRRAAAQLAGRLLAVAVVDAEIAGLLRLPGVEPVDRAIQMLRRLEERAIAYGLDPAELDLPAAEAAMDAEIARLEAELVHRRLEDGDG